MVPLNEISNDDIDISNFRVVDQDGLANVVVIVEWEYGWKNDEYPGTVITSGFQTEIGTPDPDNFIAIESLTKEILCEWIKEIEYPRLQEIEDWVNRNFPMQHKLQSSTVRFLEEFA